SPSSSLTQKKLPITLLPPPQTSTIFSREDTETLVFARYHIMSRFDGEEEEEKPPLKLKFKLKEIPTCDICFKTFSTDKSLHGHMKVHPERNYRGMGPPKKSSPPITTYSDDQVVAGNGRTDLTGVLCRGWPAEFRRGRTCDGGAGSSVKVNEDEWVMDAAYGLMFLSTDRSLPPSNKKQRISGNGGKVERLIYTEDGDNNGGIIAVGTSKKRKRRNNEMNSYTCGLCGKSFGSPQALGGHTSSGHGIKSAVSEQVLMEDAKCMSSASLHVCKECNKEFPSGQALGGHMSYHSKAPSGGVAAAAAVVVEEDHQVGGNNQVFKCFDLNEIPADD
ncbi:hypothetical protein V2J09_020659, partial [Rumex salicifolius]